MIVPMNVRGLFSGKVHWRKCLFRANLYRTWISNFNLYQWIVELTTDSIRFIEQKKSFKINDFEGFLKFQCPEQDSNLHSRKATGPWNQRVYQFHHLGRWKIFFVMSAQDKTRTCTSLRTPAPQAGVSTNFTTWAFMNKKNFCWRINIAFSGFC